MSEFANSASEALGWPGSGSKPTYDELLARVAQLEQELHTSFPAESVQRTTLQRFYSVLSSMYSGVLLVTDDGRVEFANPALCERFGLKDGNPCRGTLTAFSGALAMRQIVCHSLDAGHI
jgi:PAS domain-containing protein